MFLDVYSVLFSFYLTTCVYVCHSFHGPLRECLRTRRFWASLLQHLNLCAFPMYRPTQSIMYIPLQVHRFQKIILLIAWYKNLKIMFWRFLFPRLWSSAQDHAVLVWLLNLIRFFHFHQTTLVWWKCFVPQLYQFRRASWGGQPLNIFTWFIRAGGLAC